VADRPRWLRGRKKQYTFWQLALLGRTPWTISPNFCVSGHRGPSLIFQVSSRFVQILGVSYNRNPRLQPQKWMQYRHLESITRGYRVGQKAVVLRVAASSVMDQFKEIPLLESLLYF